MSSRQVRVGVIGFGKMGFLHAGLASALPGSRLTSVADNAAGVLDTFSAVKPDVSTYKDYEQMLESEALDAVFITSPTHLHTPMALSCVKHGIPFFIEKPLTPRSSEAVPLLEALDRKPLTNMVGFMARHIDTFRKAKQVVASGALGKLMHLRTSMYVAQLFRKGKGWRYEKEASGGGVLITQNSHLIDILLWFFGPIASVNGHVRSWYSKTVEDFAHAYLRFENGLEGSMDTSWSMRHHRNVDISIEVQGENGTLSVTDDSVTLFLDEASEEYSGGWRVWRKPDLFEGVEFDIGGPEYTRQDSEFLFAVAGAGSLDCDVRSAFRVQQVVEAIYESARLSGQSIDLSSNRAHHA
jgi:predicted dehydrogenase